MSDKLTQRELNNLLLMGYERRRNLPGDVEFAQLREYQELPVIFSGRTAILQWWTPTDEIDHYTERQLLWLHDIALGPIRFNWFGATDDCVFKGIEGADARGINVRGLFDRRQFLTPGEKPKVEALYAAVPNAREKFFPGNSQLGGAFLHSKVCTVNAQEEGYSVPDGDYDTVEEAAARGYPITWLSSWNPSGSGSKQFNFIVMIPSKIISASAVREIEALILWNRAHHPDYQLPV